MAATPDLAPGARQRTWLLLAVTAVAGVATFLIFGHTEIIWITACMLAILVYLLLGVRLSRHRDLHELQPAMAEALAELHDRHWVLIDNLGTVLHVSAQGAAALGHSAAILTGQRLGDLVPASPPELRVSFNEMLRFCAAGRSWAEETTLIAEDGAARVHRLRSIPLQGTAARRSSLIALSGDAKD